MSECAEAPTVLTSSKSIQTLVSKLLAAAVKELQGTEAEASLGSDWAVLHCGKITASRNPETMLTSIIKAALNSPSAAKRAVMRASAKLDSSAKADGQQNAPVRGQTVLTTRAVSVLGALTPESVSPLVTANAQGPWCLAICKFAGGFSHTTSPAATLGCINALWRYDAPVSGLTRD
ncbi:hypothetical protein NDU88_003671 [Pleurodeles waltl]|uniref:Uncharacterized protein n=1 Tax=Pleurodeles waltl TaxID=8319 RepID=A0AAV7TQD5_PLEWA|nr:hypothetical protein NDU88_003671 [Pleurodeles waltl]